MVENPTWYFDRDHFTPNRNKRGRANENEGSLGIAGLAFYEVATTNAFSVSM